MVGGSRQTGRRAAVPGVFFPGLPADESTGAPTAEGAPSSAGVAGASAAAESSRKWYYTCDGEQLTAREEEIAPLLAAGKLTGATLVWAKGEPGWAELERVAALRHVVASARGATLQAAEARVWHYATEDKQQRTAAEPELYALVQKGELSGHTLIWAKGEAGWVRLDHAAPFASLFSPSGAQVATPAARPPTEAAAGGASEVRWYYATLEREQRTANGEEMRALYKRGEVRRDTLVWAKSEVAWTRLDQTAAFVDLFEGEKGAAAGLDFQKEAKGEIGVMDGNKVVGSEGGTEDKAAKEKARAEELAMEEAKAKLEKEAAARAEAEQAAMRKAKAEEEAAERAAERAKAEQEAVQKAMAEKAAAEKAREEHTAEDKARAEEAAKAKAQAAVAVAEAAMAAIGVEAKDAEITASAYNTGAGDARDTSAMPPPLLNPDDPTACPSLQHAQAMADLRKELEHARRQLEATRPKHRTRTLTSEQDRKQKACQRQESRQQRRDAQRQEVSRKLRQQEMEELFSVARSAAPSVDEPLSPRSIREGEDAGGAALLAVVAKARLPTGVGRGKGPSSASTSASRPSEAAAHQPALAAAAEKTEDNIEVQRSHIEEQRATNDAVQLQHEEVERLRAEEALQEKEHTQAEEKEDLESSLEHANAEQEKERRLESQPADRGAPPPSADVVAAAKPSVESASPSACTEGAAAAAPSVASASPSACTAVPAEAPASASAWSYVSREKETKQASVPELRALYRSGAVDDATLVWAKGEADWRPLRAVTALAEVRDGGTLAGAAEAPGVAMTDTRAWYYVGPDKKQYTAPAHQLHALLLKGEVRPATLVWAKGEAGWARLDQVKALAPLLEGMPAFASHGIDLAALHASRSGKTSANKPSAPAKPTMPYNASNESISNASPGSMRLAVKKQASKAAASVSHNSDVSTHQLTSSRI